MNDVSGSASQGRIKGQEHWTKKGDVNLFLWEKRAPQGPANGTVLFVHGSSMASQPTFDLHVPGWPNSSAMEFFAERGFDAWCMDVEGYGRSTKDRGTDATIAEGADDLAAGTDYILKTRNTGPLMVYGISSGALRAALFAQRHPERVKRLALDAHVWTGEGSPTLEQRRKKLPEYLKTKRRPIDRAFVRSIFERDHPGTANDNVVERFADEILKLDDSKFVMLQAANLKDPVITLVISIVGGSLGIDRFFIGDTGLGIAKLLTCGGLGIWTIVDWFLIMGRTREINLQRLQQVFY